MNFLGGRIDATDRTGDGGYHISIGSEGQGQFHLLGKCKRVKTSGHWFEGGKDYESGVTIYRE